MIVGQNQLLCVFQCYSRNKVTTFTSKYILLTSPFAFPCKLLKIYVQIEEYPVYKSNGYKKRLVQ